MDVSSTNGISGVSAQLDVSSANQNTVQRRDSSMPPPPAQANISGPGRMFQQLSELSQSDPTKFKSVLSDMASTLRADAQKATGDQASRLSKIADRLDKAAQSGNVSDLLPQRPQGGAQGAQGSPHAHHGHHHHGGGAVMSDLESAFNSAMGNNGSTSAAASSSAGTPATSDSTTSAA